MRNANMSEPERANRPCDQPEFRVGRHQPGNLYRNNKRFGFTIADEDGPMVADALNAWKSGLCGNYEVLRAERDGAQEAATRMSREVAELTRQLRSLCEWVDRTRDAAGVGPDVEIDDLVGDVGTTRYERDEARAQVAELTRERDERQAAINDALDHLGTGDICVFQFCDGPDAEPVDMKTCRVCFAIQALRAVSEAGRAVAQEAAPRRSCPEHAGRPCLNCWACATAGAQEAGEPPIPSDLQVAPDLGVRGARVWQKGDPEPPADVTLLRLSSPSTLGARFIKRTPGDRWWFVESPREKTDPEGWLWQYAWDVEFQQSLTEVVHADDCQGCEHIPGAVHCGTEVLEGGASNG